MRMRVSMAVMFLSVLFTSCNPDEVALTQNDIVIDELLEPRDVDCLQNESNTTLGNLDLLDSIKWSAVTVELEERFNGKSVIVIASSSNPHKNDVIRIEMPYFLDQSNFMYPCKVSTSLNKLGKEKVNVFTGMNGKVFVHVDSRGEDVRLTVCNYKAFVIVLGQGEWIEFSSTISVPKSQFKL